MSDDIEQIGAAIHRQNVITRQAEYAVEREERRTALLREAAEVFEGGVFASEGCSDLAARIRKELGE